MVPNPTTQCASGRICDPAATVTRYMYVSQNGQVAFHKHMVPKSFHEQWTNAAACHRTFEIAIPCFLPNCLLKKEVNIT